MTRPGGYRRVFVPMLGNGNSERAIEIACRLASERHSSITAVAVVEVPSLLPLDAHMEEEEAAVRAELACAEAIAETYGVRLVQRVLRGRDSATPILGALAGGDFELVVIAAPRRDRARRSAIAFGRTVQHVLNRAPCRVLLISPKA